MSAPTLLSPLSIRESKTNPRKHFDAAKLAELSASIAKLGVLQPILVRPLEDGDYELVCGHRRLRAAKDAGVKAIPVNVRELSDVEALECQLVENMERADIHPLEEAAGYHALMAKPHKYTAATLAERTGRSVKYIYDRVKLLDLAKEAQALFLADRITAGHAIILARLSTADQARALDTNDGHGYGWGQGAVFEKEGGLFTPDEEDAEDERNQKDPFHGMKPRSVRELQAWVDKHVRFERKLIEPVLFPETAAAVETAKKVIPITHDHHVHPTAKAEGERTYGPMSWRRADKACDFAVLGVVVVGPGRGAAFDICIARDKCKTHWKKEIDAKGRVAKQNGKGGADGKPTGKAPYEIEEEKRKAKAAAWEKVAPAVLEAFAAAVKKAPTKSTGLLAKIIMDKIYLSRGGTSANALIPLGETADDFMRHVALQILSGAVLDPWNGHREAPSLGKAFGIDVAKIVKAATPKEEKAAKNAISDEDAALVHKLHGGKPLKAKKPKRKAS